MALAGEGEGGRGKLGRGVWGGWLRDFGRAVGIGGTACVVGMRGRQQGGRGARVCSRSIRRPGARAFACGG